MLNKKTQKVCVRALILRSDDKALLVKRSANDSRPGEWELPGGGVEFGENPMDAVIREIEEETGVNAFLHYPVKVTSYITKNGNHNIDIYFKCYVLNQNQEVYLSGEHQDYKWKDAEKINI